MYAGFGYIWIYPISTIIRYLSGQQDYHPKNSLVISLVTQNSAPF